MIHPAINASLNAFAAVLLVIGYVAIKGGNREKHERFMKGAFLVSAAFLVSYLIYHGTSHHTPYEKKDWTRWVYFPMLISHILLAMVNLPMVLRTFWLAHKKRWELHKKWARWTFPLWMYVSVTGVLVFLMLYVL